MGLRAGLAAVLAIVVVAGTARADDAHEKDVCIAASDNGQQLRDDGKYVWARESFMRCARPTCPSLVKRDCLDWLVDLEQRSPTVVVRARDEKGADLVDVRVTLDGVDLTAKLDGQPIAVDPGEHDLRYLAEGFAPLEEHVVIQAGTKNRLLDAQLSPLLAGQLTRLAIAPTPTGSEPVPSKAAALPPPAPGPSGSARLWPPPVASWIFAGVAVGAFANETYFALAGLNQRAADLRAGGCAPRCTSAEMGSIQTKFVVADVSLGAGLVSAGLATYFLLRPRAVPPAVTVGVAPSPGGALASFGGQF